MARLCHKPIHDVCKLRYGFWLGGRLPFASSASRLPLGALPLDPHVVTPAYYYNFVEFVSSAKCILFRSKQKKQVTTANVLPLVLLHFCTYF